VGIRLAGANALTPKRCQRKQDAVGDGRLRPGDATWRTRRIIRVVSDSAHLLCYVKAWRHPQNRKYITYRNCRKGTTKARPQIICGKNLAKFDHVVFEICQRTDKQTDRHTLGQGRGQGHVTDLIFGGSKKLNQSRDPD